MAYRSSHFRRGYYRRIPSGGITWVSPTIVSGYEYTPGSPCFNGRIPNIVYTDKGKPIQDFEDIGENSTLQKICDLFRTLDSKERKYCLDILDYIDIQLDEELSNSCNDVSFQLQEQSTVETNADLFLKEAYEDGICITGFTGFNEKEINIPSYIDGKPVLALGMKAFKNNNYVCSVSMPDTIISIGSQAFCLCRNLQKIKISNALKVIGPEAFCSTSIENVVLPNSIIYMGKGCFRESGVKNIKLSAALLQIEEYAFFKCKALQRVEIPLSIRKISAYAFSECTSLKEIEIPPSVLIIEPDAFSRNHYLNLDVIIKCTSGSIAQRYSRERGITISQSLVDYKTELQDKLYSICCIGYKEDLLFEEKVLKEKDIISILEYRPPCLIRIDSITFCFITSFSLDESEITNLERKTEKYNFDLYFSGI